MPCATPPWIWPSTIIGLIRRPASSATTKRSILTPPVSMSTSTIAAWQALENVPAGIVGRALGEAGTEIAAEPMALMIGGARQRLDRDRAVGAGDARDAVFEHDVVGAGLEQAAGDLHELARAPCAPPATWRRRRSPASGWRRCPSRRACGRCRRARSLMRSGAMPSSSAMICDKRRAQPLPVRRGADARFDAAGRVHAEIDGFPARRHLHAARGEGRRAVAGALGKRREAEAEIAALRARLRLARAERRHVERLDRHAPWFRR